MTGGGEALGWLQPHKYPQARGQVSQRQPHTMGRWELVVLGLACCLAVASAAKVSKSPAERSARGGSPLTSAKPDLDPGDRAQQGEDRESLAEPDHHC